VARHAYRPGDQEGSRVMNALRVELSDGSTWPRPALESDQEYGIGHRLRYAPMESLTRDDLLLAASVIDAYGYLVTMPGAQASKVARMMRAALTEGV